jgi:hypothetical protein
MKDKTSPMRYAAIPLLASAVLHVLGFALVGFAEESVFLLFPAALYCLLSVGLFRELTLAAWVTLICMIGGIVGTLIEFTGPLMAPAFILAMVILADFVVAVHLVRALWRGNRRPGIE